MKTLITELHSDIKYIKNNPIWAELTGLAKSNSGELGRVVNEALNTKNSEAFINTLAHVSNWLSISQPSTVRPTEVTEKDWQAFYIVANWTSKLKGRMIDIPKEMWGPFIEANQQTIRNFCRHVFSADPAAAAELEKFYSAWRVVRDQFRAHPTFGGQFDEMGG